MRKSDTMSQQGHTSILEQKVEVESRFERIKLLSIHQPEQSDGEKSITNARENEKAKDIC